MRPPTDPRRLDIERLWTTYREYRILLADESIPCASRRTDAKHMAFWQQYCAEVVRAVSEHEEPVLAKGTYAMINQRAQADYDHCTDGELNGILDSFITLFSRAVATVDPAVVIPYKAEVRGYSPSEYVDVMENHYRMHIKSLGALRRERRGAPPGDQGRSVRRPGTFGGGAAGAAGAC